MHCKLYKSVLGLLLRLSTWRYPHLLLSAGAPAAVDRYLQPAGRSAANPPAAVVAVNRRDRQTNGPKDRRTDARPLHRPSSAGRAGPTTQLNVRWNISVSKSINLLIKITCELNWVKTIHPSHSETIPSQCRGLPKKLRKWIQTLEINIVTKKRKRNI